jgi:RNA polymerase sigma-70 factor, ECF subfamily
MATAAEELVRAAQRGSSRAFAELIRRYERTALGIAYAITGDAHAAGDVAQEAFLRAWQRLATLESAGRFGPWLVEIVQNQARDCARSVRRLHSHETPMASLPECADEANPASALEHDETRRQLRLALEQLEEPTRIVVVLRYYQGLSAAQIAELTATTPTAVDMRLSRARKQLRQILEAEPASATAVTAKEQQPCSR